MLIPSYYHFVMHMFAGMFLTCFILELCLLRNWGKLSYLDASDICYKCLHKQSLGSKPKRFKLGLSESQNRPACFSFCSKTQHDGIDYLSDPDSDSILKSCGVAASDTVSITEPGDPALYVDNPPNSLLMRRSDICSQCRKLILPRKEDIDSG